MQSTRLQAEVDSMSVGFLAVIGPHSKINITGYMHSKWVRNTCADTTAAALPLRQAVCFNLKAHLQRIALSVPYRIIELDRK